MVLTKLDWIKKRWMRGSLIFSFLLITGAVYSQTPGMIYENPGITVLDPNGDGYVSATTDGFKVNDDIESEIDYVSIAFKETEPTSDPGPGPNCSFNDIVDTGTEEPIFVNFDGTYLRFRFRLGNTSPNSKGYSIFVDTDQKFGFTGPNLDPNAVSGNPGFEIEIVLETNFGVEVFNVDGTVTPVKVVDYSLNPYATHCQKSIALTTNCGDIDVFYDFYIPFSQITSNFPGITASTPMRFIGATSMNPAAAIGNNAISDFGGIDDSKYGNSFDLLSDALVGNSTPTSLTDVQNGNPLLDRSICPTINTPISSSATSITGTSTEATGTVIKVYKNSALLGSTTVTAGNWTLAVAGLAGNDTITASATASGKGESPRNCQKVIVGAVCNTPALTGLSANAKGICGSGGTATSNVLRVYKDGVEVSIGSNYVVNADGTWFYKINGSLSNCTSGGGLNLTNGYYEVTQTPSAGCESPKAGICYNTITNSTTPVITTPVLTSATSISGTSGANATVKVYKNSYYIASVTATVGGTWSYSVSGLASGDQFYVVAYEPAKCISLNSNTVTVVTKTNTPSILGTYCASGSPITSVTGSVNEVSGTVQIYRNGVSHGSAAAISSTGTWTATGLTLNSGDNVYAIATVGTRPASSQSATIVIGSKTSATAVITTNPIIEKSTSISGTGTTGDSIRLYVDGAYIYYKTKVVGGTWTISGIGTNEFYPGASVTVSSFTSGNCESDQSAAVIVQCNAPAAPSFTNANVGYCYGQPGEYTLSSSTSGYLYQLVDNQGNALGYTSAGTGGAIVLRTYPLTANLSGALVKIFGLISPECYSVSSSTVSFDTQNPSPTVTLDATQVSVTSGTTTANFTFSAKSVAPAADRYSITFSSAALSKGFANVPTSVLGASPIAVAVPVGAPVGTYYATLTISNSGGATCESDYTISVNVYTAGTLPSYTSQPSSKTACNGAGTSFSALVGGATSYQWQILSGTWGNVPASSPYSGVTSPTLTISDVTGLDGKQYRLVATNGSGSVNSSAATLTVNSVTGGTIASGQTICSGADVAAFSETLASSGSGALSYQWQISTDNNSFNNISSANSTTYNHGTLTQTSYFRRFTTSTLNSLDCNASSNNLTITVNSCVLPTVTLSTGAASISENGGSTSVTATLSALSASDVTVNLGYSGTASGTDYTVNTSITIPAGSLSASITLAAVNETVYEPNETVIIDITSVTNATESGVQTATVTITNDDSQPSISIDDVSAAEGSSLGFTVTLSNASYQTITVSYATSDGTATTADNDYTSIASTVLTFNPGETTKSVSVSTTTDTKYETNETLNVALSGASNATISDATGVGTITNNDSQPTISIDDVSAGEGSSLGFTVTLSNASYQTITVSYATSDGTATTFDNDYTSIGSTVLTFNPGETTKSVSVSTTTDTNYETNETLNVGLSGASNATISDATGVGTITNNDSQPTISIDDLSVAESSSLGFTITLSNASYQTITVSYATSDGTATTADNDYTSIASTVLTFNPGETTKSVSVSTTTDTKYETNETVNVGLSGASNATISDATGVGTITNDDSQPTISIDDVSAAEGSSLGFTVTLSNASYQTITVSYATSDGTATTTDNDYTSIASTVLTFNPGETTKSVSVSTTTDTKYETNETVNVGLSGASNATISDATGVGTITNNDTQPTISIDDVSAAEGSNLGFTVSLSNASYQTITVSYATSDGTATTADNDYTSNASTVLTFNPGETTKSVSVSTTTDTKYETNETLNVGLSGASNATISDATGVGTITNNDSQPTISIDDVSVAEGSGLGFTVTLSNASYQTITVSYATSDGTATTADNDYTSIGSTVLTFNPGETTKSVSVSTTTDTKYETNETVNVGLSGASNATISDATGVGTITNNNTQPTISIDDVSVAEGSSLGFTVTLSNASYQTITVSYATSDGTATTADNDYTSIGSTVLTFNPGETTKSVSVSTTTDTKYETNETLNVALSGASNATISDATGVGTITNSDSQPTISIDDLSAAEGSSLGFTVTLSNASYQTITVSYATSDGTATTADNDYTSIASTVLTFNPGETTKSVSVSTTTDTKYETNETVNVGLSGASNATISDATGVGTINNDDSQPTVTLSIGDISIVENAGSTLVTATLSNVSYQNVTVNLSFTGAATGGGTDYNLSDVKIDVPAGSLTGTITITAVQDVIVEGGESINIDISTVNNGSENGTQQVTTTIDDDDAPNHLPNAQNDTDAVNEDASVATSVAANDTGLEDGGLVVTVTSGPSHGGVSISGTTVTYTPSANYNGADSYIYQICDADGDCSSATVSITVNSVDDVVSAEADNASVNEDANVATDVSSNDTGLGDGGLVVTVTSGPTHGSVSISGTTVTYTPSANYNGADSYTYQICDADGDCSSATVSITVNSIDDVVSAEADNASVNEDASVATDVASNDTGLGDGGLVVTVTSGPTHGSVSISGTTVTYTPSANYNGADSYTYQICDADGDCSSATVSITVNSVDDVVSAEADNASVNEDANVATDVSSNDTGIGDGGLVVTVTSGPTHGSVSISGTTVTYTPSANYNGADSYTYQICDADGDCSSATVSIAVNSVDDLPVASDDNLSTLESTAVNIHQLSNDTGLGDGGLVITILSGPSHGSTALEVDQSITYTPANGYLGGDSFTYQVCDADGDCSTSTVSITIDNVDDIPVANNDAEAATEDAVSNFDVLSNDSGLSDGGLTVSIVTVSKHGTVAVNPDNTIKYTPDADFYGKDSLVYQVCDVDNDCSTAKTVITVTNVDDLTNATDDNVTVNEDSNIVTDVSANDSGLGDGGLSVSVTSGPLHGIISVSGTNITYTPDPNYNGTDSYTYQICDADGDCSSATVYIDINSVDDIPTAVNDNVSVNEDANVATDVTSNDTGLGDDGLVVTVTSGPTHGSISISGTTITYTPDANYNGIDSYTYQVCDVDNDCSSATVSITINSIDDIPVANNDNISTMENTAVNLHQLSNDTGLGDGGLVVSISVAPLHGNAIVEADNTITYTPASGYLGNDSYTYQVCDADGDCETALVSIIIDNVDDNPSAVDDAVTANEDAAATFDVLVNDTGLTDGGLLVTIITTAKHGTVIVNADNTITYTPSVDYYGKDSLVYQVCDVDNDCSTAKVVITVNNADDQPVAVNDNITVNEDTNIATDVAANDTGLGDGGLAVTVTSGPLHGTIAIVGTTVTYTPSADYFGTDSYTYQICDTDGDCVSGTVNITIDNVDDIPSATDDLVSLNEDASSGFDVLTNDTDLADGGIVVSIVTNGKHGNAIANADNTITYAPNADYNGNDTIIYMVCDANGDCSTAKLIVTVVPVNDVPSVITDNATVNEDSNTVIDVLSNDTGLGDGGIVVSIAVNPLQGTVTINPDGTISYTPAADYNGSDGFTYRVCDSNGDCIEGSVNVTVNNVNDVPVLSNDSYSGNEGDAANVNVLANDTGLGDSGIVVTISENGKHGTAVVNVDKTISYTPSGGYFGKDSVSYQVCDVNNECATAWVIFNLASTNHAPVASPGAASATTHANTPVEVCFTVTDADGDQLTATPVVAHGSVVASSSANCFLYTPAAGYTGNDTVLVRWCDPEGACISASIPVTVLPTGEKPVAKADTIFLQTTIGKEASGCVEMVTSTANLTLSTIGNPEHGSLTFDNLCMKYQPSDGFYGTIHIPVLICNNTGLCDTVIVTVDVIPVKVPQGFSPNGDGLNEYFVIEGLELYDKVSITVFNRWGNEVYKSEMYKNDWDGSSKNSFTLGNSKLPAGTYFYVVDFHDGKKPVVGYVYLSR